MRRECVQEEEGGSSWETQSKTRINVLGFFKGPLFFFPWSIFTEIRGFIVTHFRQLCQYIGVEWSGGGWGVITVYMDFVGGGRLREREQSAGGWLRDRFRGFTK